MPHVLNALRHRPSARAVGVFAAALLVAEIIAVRGLLGDAFTDVLSARPFWVLVAIAATLVSMAMFARTQRRMLRAAGVRVPLPRMLATVYAANAVNLTLPGGSALSVAYLVRRARTWGATGSAAGFMLVASGALSTGSFVLLAVAGALAGGSSVTWLLASISSLGLFAVAVVVTRVATPARFARAGARWGDHRRLATLLGHAERIAADLRAVHPTRRDWLAGMTFAAMNWVADLVCLVAAGEAVGSRAGIAVALAAYVAGMTASTVSFLPGGFGTVEIAMVLVFTGGGTSTATATAAVAVYRLISVLLVVLIGWLAWLAPRLRSEVRPPVRVSRSAPASSWVRGGRAGGGMCFPRRGGTRQR